MKIKYSLQLDDLAIRKQLLQLQLQKTCKCNCISS